MAADPKSSLAEFQSAVEEIRQRVAARQTRAVPHGMSIPLVDVNPLARARDAAEAKVAAIGTVNPRPPGALNSLIQSVKRMLARTLDWYVRDQVLFNQGVMHCVQATISALNENNQVLAAIGHRMDAIEARIAERNGDTERISSDFEDLRAHWTQWRPGLETRVADNEARFLRSLAEMQSAYQHRLTLAEQSIREQFNTAQTAAGQSAREAVRVHHEQFREELDAAVRNLQEQMWKDMAAIRSDYERLIHNELRIVRRRMGTSQPSQPPPKLEETLDYGAFAERFRGPESYVRGSHANYIEEFRNCRRVVDLGFGRGEFLESMREANISAVGIEASPELVALGQAKGLEVEEADLFVYLSNLAPASVDGILCSQVVEHLPPARVPELVRLAAATLDQGGVLVIETPNPECLAIFATHFYLDPTHSRPVPSALLAFYLEENGFHKIEIRTLAPARETIPELNELPEGVRDRLFGGLDYAIIARKL